MGFNRAEAQAYAGYEGKPNEDLTPRPLPMQALDHAAGYLLAFGINAALCRSTIVRQTAMVVMVRAKECAQEGGSWEVRVSLAAVGNWIRSLGRVDSSRAFGQGVPFPPRTVPQHDEISAASVHLEQSAGAHVVPSRRKTMTALRHSAELSVTPIQEGEAPMRLHADYARWTSEEA